jgi:hypothetical protein
VIQRFGSALNLNVIAVDGVYAPDETGELLFRSAPHPTTGDVEALIERIATRCEARPPLAKSRLVALENGRVALVLRRPWSDGTTEKVFTRGELVERLAALVPPRQSNQVLYHGVFAARSKLRALVVPRRAPRPKTGMIRASGGVFPEVVRRAAIRPSRWDRAP